MKNTWRSFSAAPHRVMFLSGAMQGVAAMLWWIWELAGRNGVLAQPSASFIPPIWTHAYLMIYGFFPFFIFGFLFTTYPNWMNGEKVTASHYVPAFLFMAAGVLVFYAGLNLGMPAITAGVVLMMAGWAIAVYALLKVQVTAAHPDKRHATVTSMALVLGWCGMAGYLHWLVTAQSWGLEFARAVGVWFFLLPVFITVSHRMIPFFSSKVLEKYRVIRPYWVLWLMLLCGMGHGVLQLVGKFAYQWVFDLPLAATALILSALWGLHRSFGSRLLAVLHVAFLWLGLAFVLFSAQSLAQFLSQGDMFQFGMAPLHALAIGFFSSMMLGMVSRVTLGHSGLPLVADAVTCAFFWGFQLVALLRIIPELYGADSEVAGIMYLLAAGVWLLSFVPWVVKYAPNYWRPRADGKPG